MTDNPGVLEEAAQIARERKANPILPRHRESAATIRANLYRACPDMPNYPVGIVEEVIAASEARLLARLGDDDMVEDVQDCGPIGCCSIISAASAKDILTAIADRLKGEG
jgi:hypothetical protein